ncbi:MAG TPA: hypothetical protein VGK81_10675 [Anaerolineae bacterium]
MAQTSNQMDVYLEIGQKRAFAGAIEWPGWCRSGRDEASALQALIDYAPRYARALRNTGLGFRAPAGTSAFSVIERLTGTGNTDFGALGAPPSSDARPVSAAELERFQSVLKACWQTFDSAVRAAGGKELRKGPRGGGRDVEDIVKHVLGAQAAYLSRMGLKLPPGAEDDPAQVKLATLQALAMAPRDGVVTKGPRGGLHWTSRYFIRRVAWHVLDHAWEIEDRSE